MTFLTFWGGCLWIPTYHYCTNLRTYLNSNNITDNNPKAQLQLVLVVPKQMITTSPSVWFRRTADGDDILPLVAEQKLQGRPLWGIFEAQRRQDFLGCHGLEFNFGRLGQHIIVISLFVWLFIYICFMFNYSFFPFLCDCLWLGLCVWMIWIICRWTHLKITVSIGPSIWGHPRDQGLSEPKV